MYPAGLISCALLERDRHNQHDFENEPMAYTSHNISMDHKLVQALRSNDVRHLLVDEPTTLNTAKGARHQLHHCFGLRHTGAILFRAEISMMPFAAILKAT